MIPTLTPALLAFTPPPGGGGNALLGPIFMYGAIFAIFYFVLIRPQQGQRKQHEQLIYSLKRGDEVVTAGGVVGEVVHIKESMKDGAAQRTMEDRVTIKSADTRLIVERGKITRIITPPAPASKPEKGDG